MSLPRNLVHFALDHVPSFADFLPYLAYDDTRSLYLLAKDTGLADLAWGFAFECLPHPGPGQNQTILLKGLCELPWPVGSTLQVSTFGLRTEALRTLQEHVRIRQPGLHREMARLRVDALHRLLMTGDHVLQVAPLRDLTVLVSATVPINRPGRWSRVAAFGRALRQTIQPGNGGGPADLQRAVPHVARLMTDVEQSLAQANLVPRPLAPPRLLTLLFPVLNPGHPTLFFTHAEPDRELRRQLVMADTRIAQADDEAVIDGHHVRSLTAFQYPQEHTLDRMSTMIGDLYNASQQFPTPFILTLNAVMYEKSDAERSFRRKHAITSQQAFGPMARIIPRLGMKKEHYDVAARAFENGHLPVSAFLHLLVWSDAAAEANQALAAAETLWRMHGFVAQRDGPATLNLLKESLPMGLSSNPLYLERNLARAKTMLSSNAATLCPIAGDWKGTGDPVMLLVSRRGQPCTLDPFENPLGGFNVAVGGITGSGKSFFVNDLLLGLIGVGSQVWIIDKGQSYRKLVLTLKGDYLAFTPGEPVCINPFSEIDPGEFEDRIPGLKALVGQMAAPARLLDAYENAVIGQVIQEAYAAAGRGTTVTMIAAGLAGRPDPRCQDLAQMLHPYTARGEFARYFEGPATVTLKNSPLLLLELEKLGAKPELQGVVFLALVLAVQEAMEAGDRTRRKVVCIDEAWQFLRSPLAAAFVEYIYRTFRKYKGSAITITQEIVDLFKSDAGEAILANSDLRVLFRHKGESLRDPRVELDQHEVALIRSLTKVSGKYSECYVKHATGAGVYRHIVDPRAYWLFTTTASEVARITALEGEGLSLEEAVRQVIVESGGADAEPAPELAAVRAGEGEERP